MHTILFPTTIPAILFVATPLGSETHTLGYLQHNHFPARCLTPEMPLKIKVQVLGKFEDSNSVTQGERHVC